MEQRSSLTQNVMQNCCSTCSVILNAMATQYTSMLTQRSLPLPPTSTVKSSLFTHVHPSPLSLAARLRQFHANRSHCINNGWTFSRQTLYILIIMERELHVYHSMRDVSFVELPLDKARETLCVSYLLLYNKLC